MSAPLNHWASTITTCGSDPVTCAAHAKEHGPLSKPGWKQFKKCAHKAKTLQHLLNNAKQTQGFGQIVHKFGVCIPHNEKEALMLDRENGNACGQDTNEAETGHSSHLSARCLKTWARTQLCQKVIS